MENDYAVSPWDNFTNIMADNLGIESTTIDPSTTFQEIGGTSLNIVSAVLKLQESGFPVTIAQFMEASSMEKLFLTAASTTSSGKAAGGHQFSVQGLRSVEKSGAQTLMARSFLQKNDIFAKCGDMQLEDFLFAYGKWWDCLQQHSLVVLDEEGKLRAVAVAADQSLLDQNPPDDQIHSHFFQVFTMLDSVTREIKNELNPTGEKGIVLCKFMLGASVDNTAEENVIAFDMIERELMKMARKDGFSYTIAENISPLTQQLSQYLGCKRYLTLQMNQWLNAAGKQPFANCSDDSCLTVDVYEVNPQ